MSSANRNIKARTIKYNKYFNKPNYMWVDFRVTKRVVELLLYSYLIHCPSQNFNYKVNYTSTRIAFYIRVGTRGMTFFLFGIQKEKRTRIFEIKSKISILIIKSFSAKLYMSCNGMTTNLQAFWVRIWCIFESKLAYELEFKLFSLWVCSTYNKLVIHLFIVIHPKCT